MISKIIGRSSLVLLVICVIFAMSSVPALADSNAEAEANAGASINTMNDINIQFPEAKDLTRTQIDAKGYRGFPNQGEINYPGMPGYFGNAVPGSSFQSVKIGLMYKDLFTVDELKKMSKDNTINGSLGSIKSS